MSVTIDRFKRVLGGTAATSDKLVGVRDGKADKAINALQAEIDRAQSANLPCDALIATKDRLDSARRDAWASADNASICAALEAVKDDARAAAAMARKQVDALLVQGRQGPAGMAALTACNDAAAAVAQIADPVLRAELEKPLAGLQNRRVSGLDADTPATVAKAAAALPGIIADATALTTRATSLAARAAEKAQHLVGIDTTLTSLRSETAKISEAANLKGPAKTLAALTSRRDALAAAGEAALTAALAQAPALATDLDAALAFATAQASFCRRKEDRAEIARSAPAFRAEGKKRNLPDIQTRASALLTSLAAIQKQSVAQPAEAEAAFKDQLWGQFSKLKNTMMNLVQQTVVPKVRGLIEQEPDGPEAQLQEAIGGLPFEALVVKMNLTAMSFGVNIDQLRPGEAAAIAAYTGGDYKRMNEVLLGLPPPPTAKERGKVETKNRLTTQAMDKLPAYKGVTKRGEKEWPGADDRYRAGNEFVSEAFWSTGIGYSFNYKYQITVNGRSGKNVAFLSQKPNEAEILFAPGVRFRVTDRDDSQAPDKIFIVVEEI